MLFQLGLEGLLALGDLLGLVLKGIEEERAVYRFGREEKVLQALLLLGRGVQLTQIDVRCPEHGNCRSDLVVFDFRLYF